MAITFQWCQDTAQLVIVQIAALQAGWHSLAGGARLARLLQAHA
jgi:hypothetical protein